MRYADPMGSVTLHSIYGFQFPHAVTKLLCEQCLPIGGYDLDVMVLGMHADNVISKRAGDSGNQTAQRTASGPVCPFCFGELR